MRSSAACGPSRIGRRSSANRLSPAPPRYDLLTWVSTSRCSAALMVFKIGVLPAPSRQTPTPTSIFSARGSALHRAISCSSESLCTGGRSASPLALASVVSMEARLAKLCVVIHRDPVTDRNGLAGEHVAGLDFLVRKPVAGRHFNFTRADSGTAGRADSGLAGERRREPGLARAVENVAGRERDPACAAIERDGNGHTLRRALQLRHLLCDRAGGPVCGEAFDVDPSPLDVPV